MPYVPDTVPGKRVPPAPGRVRKAEATLATCTL
jgi:hypothetical protein